MTQPILHFPNIPSEFYTQLSALAFVGGDMWVGADEGQGIVRLQPSSDDKKWEAGAASSLAGILDLPGEKEIDLEGMDFDPEKGNLWVIGSHSLKRKNPDDDSSDLEKRRLKNLKKLGTVEADKNRYILACLPMVVESSGSRLLQFAEFTDKQFSAQLESGEFHNALYDALQNDPHFGRFLQRKLDNETDSKGIPSKDNGLDIEGLAFAGTTEKGAARLFIGLRGPVLRGWATVLEIHVTPERAGGTNAGRLKLEIAGEDKPPGEEKLPHRRIFLELDGLGIRDICFRGDDLLILAGPTMVLDWPASVYLWEGARKADNKDRMLDQKSGVIKHLDIPSTPNPKGEKGNRAEGLALYPPGKTDSVLVLYDAPGKSHLPADMTVSGDVFKLPLPPL